WRSVSIKNEVFAKLDLTVLSHLLEPGQAILMRRQARDDVDQSIAVNIINDHLSSARAEGCRFTHPLRISFEQRRRLRPAILLEDVGAAIAIDVTAAQAVRKALLFSLGRDWMKRPGQIGMFPIG